MTLREQILEKLNDLNVSRITPEEICAMFPNRATTIKSILVQMKNEGLIIKVDEIRKGGYRTPIYSLTGEPMTETTTFRLPKVITTANYYSNLL